MKIHIDFEKARLSGISGLIIMFALVFACIVLSYVLLHNPHRDLHNKIFEIADKTVKYYRDQPGYWKLSTQSAIDNGLLDKNLKQLKEFDIQIGQGIDGAFSLPNNMSFDITLKNLNKSACISLSEMTIAKDKQLLLQKITVITSEKTTEFSWGEDNSLPVKKYSTRDICMPQDNIVMWTFQ